jgi:Flp pilus assembly protein TadD
MPDPLRSDLIRMGLQGDQGRALAELQPQDRGRRRGGLHRWHRFAAMALCLAMLLVLVTPALAADRAKRDRRSAQPAPTMEPVPVPPPTPTALALLDAAIAAGRLADARALMAPMWASNSPDVALRGAELALASGSWPEAAEGFTALTDGPLAALAWQGLGIVRLKQGKPAEAAAALDKAVALDAGLARAWNARAVLADRQRDWAAADAAYAKAVAAAPGDAALLANRGWSMLLRGHHVAAERDLERALAMAPANTVVRTNLALARAMQGRYQDAFRHSDRASLAVDLNSVGYAAMARGDLAVAEAYFNRALSLNPRFDRTAWANLQYLAELKSRAVPPGEGRSGMQPELQP